MSEGFEVDKVEVELSKSSMDSIMKRFKKLKKFSKSNFVAIMKADKKRTIIDELIDEAKDFKM